MYSSTQVMGNGANFVENVVFKSERFKAPETVYKHFS